MLSLEKELRFAEAEAERCRQQFTEVTAERRCLDERLDELQMALDSAREETKMAAEMERRGRQEREEERDAQALVSSCGNLEFSFASGGECMWFLVRV